nr:NADH-ubiquinone oxidoreductase chain 5-like [Tanacetum cinerariifolium]
MVGMVIGFVMYVILVGMMIVLELFVGYRYGDNLFRIHIIKRVMIGISCGLVLLVWFLLFIVIQTVLYLVCKSFHHEAIDKLSLSTFLGAHNGETTVLPNSGEEMQLGRTQASV